MHRRTLLVFAFVMSIAATAFFSYRSARAEDPIQPSAPSDLSRVQIITYSSGLTGFFDAQTGTLYVYDSNWDKCVFIKKLKTLGEPMESLRDPRKKD